MHENPDLTWVSHKNTGIWSQLLCFCSSHASIGTFPGRWSGHKINTLASRSVKQYAQVAVCRAREGKSIMFFGIVWLRILFTVSSKRMEWLSFVVTVARCSLW